MQWLVRIGYTNGNIKEVLICNELDFAKFNAYVLRFSNDINYVKWLNEA